MALNDKATLAVDSGNYFIAPVGTKLPADLRNIGSPWEKIGHTSLEDILSIESDGGDATVLGSLQNRNLRVKRANRTETMSLSLHQFDEASLKLYYGSNSKKLADGTMSVPSTPVASQYAFLAVFVDADNLFAFYAPLAEIMRGDDVEIADTESLAALPLTVTPLNYQGNDYAYAVTPLAITAPTP